MTTQVETRTKPAKVVIVEDHQMFREWLARMICETGDFAVCGETDNIREALGMIQATQPDVVILDISLRGSSGVELLKDMKAQGITTPVLVLSMHETALYAERALRAGARGYITKHVASSTLITALREVLSGGLYYDQKTTSDLLRKLAKPRSEKGSGVDSLTDRELEVFQHIGRGRTSPQIAKLLSLGESTVDTYRSRIKEKLNLRGASEVCSFAAQWLHEHGA